MAERDPQLVSEQKRINRKKSQRNIRFVRLMLWMVAFFVMFIILGFTTQISQATNLPIGAFDTVIRVLTLLFLLGFSASFVNSIFKNRFEMGYEDLLFIKVYDALDKIDAYVAESNEDYKKNAENSIDRLMFDIDSWDAGSLKVCQLEMNPHIVPFKNAFYSKIVGTVRKGEINDWRNAFVILRMFAKFLVNKTPRIEELDDITALMNKDIVVTLPVKKKENISLNYLMKISMFKHALWIVLFTAIGVILAYLGYIVNVPIEYDYIEAIGVPLALIAVYFAYIKKQT